MTRDETANIRQPRFTDAGGIVGILGLLIGLAPSLFVVTTYAIYWYESVFHNQLAFTLLPISWLHLMFVPTIFGFLICTPLAQSCCRFANRHGSKIGEKLAEIGASLSFLPFIIVWSYEIICAFAYGPRFP
ncbi:hypothetical protein Pan258_13800 [Symmachiella dynata]|nr:hypothetical protein Pan258_13800 [Symmachiella dynata]